MEPLPLELQQAIEEGELTDEQLRELITLETKALGLTFEEAVGRASNRTLPHNVLGSDLEFLVYLRFCIADLGVRPRSREWTRILLDSTLITA